MFILYLATLLNLLDVAIFLCGIFRAFLYIQSCFLQTDTILLLPFWFGCFFICFFSRLIVLVGISSACCTGVLKVSALVVFPNLVFSLLLLNVVLTMGLLCICIFLYVFTFWNVFLLYLFAEDFYHESMLKFCVYWENDMTFICRFMMWCITFIDLSLLNHPWILGLSLTRSWYVILLMGCWFQFANVFWYFLCVYSSWILAILSWCLFLTFVSEYYWR